MNQKEREELRLLEQKCNECQIHAQTVNNPVNCGGCYVRDRIADLEE